MTVENHDKPPQGRMIGIHQCKDRFSKLVSEVEAGEIIIVTRDGQPTAKLVPLNYGEEKREWSPAVQAFFAGVLSGELPYDEHGGIDIEQMPPFADKGLFE